MTKRDAPDFYMLKAQREGYPARSVYKLEEMEQKFKILRRDSPVLDIGSSPGSWSLFIQRRWKNKGLVVGVDLNPPDFDPPEGFEFIQGDILDDELALKLLKHGPFGTLLSDAAPSTTGNKTVDISRSEAIAERVLLLSRTHLMAGGNLVVKVFQGGGERALVMLARELFESGRTFRPKAVRRESSETYIVAMGKRKEIDA